MGQWLSVTIANTTKTWGLECLGPPLGKSDKTFYVRLSVFKLFATMSKGKTSVHNSYVLLSSETRYIFKINM